MSCGKTDNRTSQVAPAFDNKGLFTGTRLAFWIDSVRRSLLGFVFRSTFPVVYGEAVD